ncbi:MAG: hypothetical protein KIT18_13100, partial [Burkholderiales bacterium]|nr:hypothetical protein [Burkholderiales bacterium]
HGMLSETPPLIRTREQYEAAVRGAGSLEGLIAIEFMDTSDAVGIYRKYGCFVVGERIVPRHLFFSRNWLVKGADLHEPAMIEEELAFLESSPHAQLLSEAMRLANIGFGRIDYALLDGQPQIWEVNITPGFISGLAPGGTARDAVHRRFAALFSEALDALDPPPSTYSFRVG